MKKREGEGETDRQTDRKADRQTDWRADRHTDIQTDRQTRKLRGTGIPKNKVKATKAQMLTDAKSQSNAYTDASLYVRAQFCNR